MKELFCYLDSIKDTEIMENPAEITRNISKFIPDRLIDDDLAFGTFVLHFPSFTYIYTSDTNKIFGEDYITSNVIKVDEFFSKMHPVDIDVHHQKMLPYLHNYVKALEQHELINSVFSFDFRILNEKGSMKTFISKNMMVLNDQKEVIFIFGKAVEISTFSSDPPGKVNLTITHHRETGTEVFSKTFISNNEFFISEREMQVLILLREGKSSKQIAEQLYISVHTVNNHRKNMLKKTGSQNTMELIDLAARKGLI